MIKVSVIIPAYNVENYVEECLNSLLEQSFTDYEIICVDDDSSDNTYTLMRNYSEKYNCITVIQNLVNEGAAFSRNKGLELAKGEYVIFLDADDTYHPQLLEKLYIAIKSENADVAVCNVNYCDRNGEAFLQSGWDCELIKTNVLTQEDNRENIFTAILIAPWNKLVKKSFLKKNNINFQDLKTSNDVFYSMMVVACAKKIVLIPDVLVFYRHERTGNITEYKKHIKNHIICAYEKVIRQLRARGLWKNDIQKAGITAIVKHCYSIVTQSNVQTQQYYIDEWKNRIEPILPKEEVYRFGGNLVYFQYLGMCNELPLCKNVYALLSMEIVEYMEGIGSKAIVLWGAGKWGYDFLTAIPDVKRYVQYIVDNDINKQGKYLCEIEICSYESIKDKADRYLILNERYMESISQQVEEPERLVNMSKVLEKLMFGYMCKNGIVGEKRE